MTRNSQKTEIIPKMNVYLITKDKVQRLNREGNWFKTIFLPAINQQNFIINPKLDDYWNAIRNTLLGKIKLNNVKVNEYNDIKFISFQYNNQILAFVMGNEKSDSLNEIYNLVDKKESNIYYLMHKNDIVMKFDVDSDFHIRRCWQYEPGMKPLSFVGDRKNALKNWLLKRVIPTNRKYYDRLIDAFKFLDYSEVIIKTRSLSLIDSYWIKNENENLKFEDVNYFTNSFTGLFDHIYLSPETLDRHKPKKIEDILTPSNTIGGSLPKVWKIFNGERWLLKGNDKKIQDYNEIFWYKVLSHIGIDCAEYKFIKNPDDGKEYIATKNFINYGEDFITADALYDSLVEKSSNNIVEDLINAMNKNFNVNIRSFMNKMILLDYIFMNEDRHWNNFGFIFKDNKFVRIAPLYDHGNSLLFKYNDGNRDKDNLQSNFASKLSSKQCLDYIKDYKYDLPDNFLEVILKNKYIVQTSSNNYMLELFQSIAKNIKYVKERFS